MATHPITCWNCGHGVAANIVWNSGGTPPVYALLCPLCLEGSVKVRGGAVYPTAPAGGNVRNLPPDVEHAWREARTAHAVAAYTASEIMCRKILMHVAVDVAEADKGQNFIDYIDALDKKGYITTGMKPVIDKIRERGNAANHELPASTEQESSTTLGVTEHLLTSVYAFAEPSSG